ncbi:MAG: hypothetical protein H9W81_07900 [Enterococcus sp.]|nr:hypothetical protein [Enterococcus sp.]
MKTSYLIASLYPYIEQYRNLLESMYEDSRKVIIAPPETLRLLDTLSAQALVAKRLVDILHSTGKRSASREEEKALVAKAKEDYFNSPEHSMLGMQVFNEVIDKL